ncbi:hypothetical protein [Mangrovibacterium diazotrophicum]|uniref:Lipocalin-like protein n=1 Tax=Mangrovibacterium diazotrophicum TaxID=1261403 RepID=A0A419W8Z7_9BACT|nr:hypothetical protein [Mangrovibacterium diazotrophicum]RKD91935.1 hypothetical protein BC643_2304 [Mangrovibacterium diazotrophicum]
MKKLLILLITISALFSCSDTEDAPQAKLFDSDHYPQKWILVEMSGQIPNSVTTGSDMPWQEYYILKSDGTFLKHRDDSGNSLEGTGTFHFTTDENGELLELNYSESNAIVGTCSSVKQAEELRLDASDKLIGTWSACDGPGLKYERFE